MLGDDNVLAEAYATAVTQILSTDEKELSKLRNRIKKAAPAQDWVDVARSWAEVLHDR